MSDIVRKNYSFYMPADFDEKLKNIQQQDGRLSALSKSQAVYYIISEIESTGKFKSAAKN